jgi:hypothetical protein
MQQPAARLRTAIVTLVLTTQLATCLAPALAAAQGAGTSNVQKGQEYYEQSRFDEAISLLKDLVDRGALAGDDLQRARELLARSYVKKGYPVQGKEMFKAILRTTPTWRPDPIRVPPDETAVFEQALKEYTAESAAGGTPPAGGTETAPVPGATTTPAPTTPTTPPPAPKTAPTAESVGVPSAASAEGGKKSSKKMWYIIGGAALIGGIVAVAAGGGGGGGGSTPDPALAGFPGAPTP